MTYEQLHMLSYLPLFCLIPSCIIWFLKQYRFPAPLKIFGYFLLLNLFTEAAARGLVIWDVIDNNLPLLHIYTAGEFVLLSFFYRSLFANSAFVRRYFLAFILFICALIAFNSAFLQSIYIFNSYAKTLVQIIIITYSILFFFHLPERTNLKNPEDWAIRIINSAVLIYYCGSLFIFMFSNLFIGKGLIYNGFWAFNALLNFIFQLLVLIGLWRVAFKHPKFSF